MSDPISPIGGASGPGRISRRAAAPAGSSEKAGGQSPDDGARLPVPVEPAPQPRSRLGALAGFAAQLLGQGGQRRGLRGGRETLDKARTTYLETEWSGPADRRHGRGRITKTEI